MAFAALPQVARYDRRPAGRLHAQHAGGVVVPAPFPGVGKVGMEDGKAYAVPFPAIVAAAG